MELNSAQGAQPLNEQDVPAIQRNFWLFAISFAMNHGTVTTPLVVATTFLPEEVANTGSAILYVFTCISSLLLGAPVTGYLGAKGGLLFGMTFYCVYVTGFTLAIVFTGSNFLQVTCWLVGSICGGIAAGVLWTAQGSYFAATATLLAEAHGTTREVQTAKLAGSFAMVYLLLEVGSKLLFTLLKLMLPTSLCGVAFTAIAVLSLFGMSAAKDIGKPAAGTSARVNPLAKLFAAASLWSDPVVWLLSPTNFVFGFCAAFMNGYVNGNFTKVEIGEEYVPALGAFTALVAAGLSPLFGLMAQVTGKGPVLFVGHLCFLCIPLLLLLTVKCLGQEGCQSGWGWGLGVLYLLQGSGRAVYESTNRATFSDFFTGDRTEGAFANCMLQSSLSFATCFFLQTALKQGIALEIIVIVLAALIVVTFPLALLIKRGRDAKATNDEGLHG
eukprot:TRINITY_DN101335_c0_g1_i1.p1 TRINITY_DN101335_c0_g1~~TRINITY_DN101335_c0_g1_i1.p1  ORF type:complete len:442 (+),score=93.66 TRINITY_DN101335_c0_g1_i1:104-1429(+)